jgi:hypothetical protein
MTSLPPSLPSPPPCPHTRFHLLRLIRLSVPLVCDGNNLGDEALQTQGVILSVYVDYKVNEWVIVKIFMCKIF